MIIFDQKSYRVFLTSAYICVLAGCAMSSVHRNTVKGIGLSPILQNESCSAQCVEKVDTPDGGEKCLKFTEGMAKVCFKDKDKEQAVGTFVDVNP
jgi:hypothetical protein